VTLRVRRMFGRSDDKHGPNGAFPTSNAPLCGAGQSHALWAWSFTLFFFRKEIWPQECFVRHSRLGKTGDLRRL